MTKQINLSQTKLSELPHGLKVELAVAFDHLHGTIVPVEISGHEDAVGIKDDRMDYIWKLFRDPAKQNPWSAAPVFILGFGGVRGIWEAEEPWTGDDWNREICGTGRSTWIRIGAA